jgi:DNA adenine methylase
MVPDDARYFEPFLGGGAVFFARRPAVAFLSDKNRNLIETFAAVRDSPDAVWGYLKEWRPSKATYYRIRSAMFRGSAQRAARFIYLNRVGWNGLYRVNRAGRFNVPFGAVKGRRLYERRGILKASVLLHRAVLQTGDFEACVEKARAGDFVYLDPPYTVRHDRNGFVRYNELLFTWADQVRLARVAGALCQRGCRVAVTNANHRSLVALYPTFRVVRLRRPTTIAGDPSKRGFAEEVLLTCC